MATIPLEAAALDAASVDDWLDEVAELAGSSRETVVKQLVLSHWTLTEIAALVEDAPTNLTTPKEEPRTPRSGPPDATLATIRDRLDALEAGLADVRTDAVSPETMAEVRTRLTQVEHSIEDGSPTTDDHAGLEARHEALERLVEAEFGHLRPILAHLIETTDELDGRLPEEDVEQLRRRQADLERLAAIRHAALRHDVLTATCGACGATVDPHELTQPSCGHCDAHFEALRPPTGWFGRGSATLTAAEVTDPGPADCAPDPVTIEWRYNTAP